LFRRRGAPSKSGSRDCHRSAWIVAVTPRDPSLAPKLFAVDGQQNIIAADRHGRAMMSADFARCRGFDETGQPVGVVERNPAPFHGRRGVMCGTAGPEQASREVVDGDHAPRNQSGDGNRLGQLSARPATR